MPGEMSVDDRHLYHEALEALFPPDIAISAAEAGETNGKKRSPIMGAVKKRLSQAARVLRPKTLSLLRLAVDTTAATTFRVTRSLA